MPLSRVVCVAVFSALLLAALAESQAAGRPPPAWAEPSTARGQGGMVVAAEAHAAEAGVEILRRGGNAVDAAVAVAFALAVTHSAAGNLGGGGFMLIRLANGAAIMVDYRELAPLAARADMYLNAEGNFVPERSTLGWQAAGVPGTVAGLELALRAYGTMSLEEIIAPAIRLAENGFPVSERLARDLRQAAPRLERFSESRRIFLRNGRYYQPGEIFKQKELAKTLKKIARGGTREFYEGSIAQRLAREMRRHGGLITLEDLRRYRARLREPLRGSFAGYEIITAPPPSSGGVALLEMLNILGPLLSGNSAPLAPDTVHLIAEAMRRAFADRARYLGDPDFAAMPVRGLLDKRYADELRASIDPQRASASEQLLLPDPYRYQARAAAAAVHLQEAEDTTHFSVVDAAGNAVANTYTINYLYGNGVTVPGLGFLLNNEMDDFSPKAGTANTAGLVHAEANKIAPRKRPLSCMTPTIVVRDNETVLVLGSPGGPRIINAVFLVLLNRLAFGLDLAAAVALPRYHHQWLPDKLFLEDEGVAAGLLEALRARGHTLEPRGYVGTVNAIERNLATGELYGVGDGRRGGVARGLPQPEAAQAVREKQP